MKHYRLFSLFALFMVAVTSMRAQFSGGSGTEADPYQISTAADLIALSTNVSNGTLYSDNYFVLTADLDMSEQSSFKPIGYYYVSYGDSNNKDYPFKGNFNGQGHAVKLQMDITDTDTGYPYVGLFGQIQGATIQYVEVQGSVQNQRTSGNGTGGIVGYATCSTISHCINNATVTHVMTNTTGANSVGGIAGYAKGLSSSECGLIEYCENNGAVQGSYYVGGIVGYDINYADITNCQNFGTVTSTTNYFANNPYVGGISGRTAMYCTIGYCTNCGDIVATLGESYLQSTGVSGTTRYIGVINGYEYVESSLKPTYTDNQYLSTVKLMYSKNTALSDISDFTNGATAISEAPAHFKIKSTTPITDPAEVLIGVQPLDVTTNKVEFTYNGAAQTPTITLTLKADNSTLTEGTDYILSYEKQTGAEEWQVIAAESVVDAGSYRCTVEGIGSYEDSYTQPFTILKAPLTVTADAKSKEYGEENPTLTYTYDELLGSDDETVFTGVLACAADASSAPGTYDITLGTLSAGDNYEITFTGAQLTVNTINMESGVAATPYNAAYDGNAHSISVLLSGAAEGATITYCDTEDGTYQSENYPYTDATAARTVWYKVVKENYTTVTGSATVTITQASNSFTAQPNITDWTYGETANLPTEGVAKFGDITYLYSNAADGTYDTYENVVKGNAGTWYVKGFVAETANYAAAESDAVKFTIAKADITMSAPIAADDLVYTGEAQTLVTAGTASFGTVLYSTDGETYAETLPTATDADTYTVYYKVEGDDNHNAVDAQTVSVTIAANKADLNDAISKAEAYYESISEDDPDTANVLLEAINAAKAVQDNDDATQTEVETAVQTLNEAVEAAKVVVTVINTIKTAVDGNWYDLNGRRLSGKPSAKGVYITGGRKVVIK